jgi:hypothetical protein
MRDKEENKIYMREYFKKNPLINSLNCINKNRKKLGYNPIDLNEYIEYKKFIGEDKRGRIKSLGSKKSKYMLWEEYKKYI